MKKYERLLMVKAMEYIVRQINDESVFDEWLTLGVADGDIQYGDFDGDLESMEELSYYLEDDNFKNLMKVFQAIIIRAYKSGGLSCDGVTV